jgi:hypothetical protein
VRSRATCTCSRSRSKKGLGRGILRGVPAFSHVPAPRRRTVLSLSFRSMRTRLLSRKVSPISGGVPWPPSDPSRVFSVAAPRIPSYPAWPSLGPRRMGGAPNRRSPFPLLGGYRSTRHLRTHHPFGVQRNHPFGVCATALLGSTISLLISRVPLIPLQGLAARLFYSYRAGPMAQGVSYVGYDHESS